MAQAADPSPSSPAPPGAARDRPVVVRVKRKVTQARLDAFWLEINERPYKRPLLDFGSLSISDSPAGKGVEESRIKKLFVQHVDTIRESEDIEDVVHSFLDPNFNDIKETRSKIDERRSQFKKDNKQDRLRSLSRHAHEGMVRTTRFEQIWKSRRSRKDDGEESLREICHLYDVVQVDGEDKTGEKPQKPQISSQEEDAILCNYLPLILEYLPAAASEIESDILAHSSGEDGYVYDLYAVEDGINTKMADVTTEYPLVQVDDDDYYDGSLQSEYESDDSNAEDNPLNDYPDEEPTEDEDEGRDPFDDIDASDSEYEKEEVDLEEDEGYWRMEH